MPKNYRLEPGYITVPEANKVVLNMLRITNQDETSHYKKILQGAKEGLYGGKKHGARMYQVRLKDIKEYALQCLETEQLQLYKIEVVKNLSKVEAEKHLPVVDNSTAKKIQYYLKYLMVYGIITEEMFEEGEKNLVLRLKMKRIKL
ncbi:hypothetical protein N0O92_16425 [Alkalihalobacillus sp. MEB130]|uniref:hypothetical protein n=1 Tax=Alkalihalobacillus sp. MEB130 TaxID=2976704 RepID=UPI0028DF4B4C|nr:hypothetical protein [Alkalihalobacillus sp. MEB130]MDT8861800.1 hypothetical protein [Alkalihalobacillus sp. MEB130]